MKNLKICKLIIILMLISIYGFAQENNTAAINLLDEVAAKMDKYSTLKIEFILEIDNGQSGKTENHSGQAIYKNGLYKMDLMGQIIFSDGKTNWTYLKDAEEVNITSNSSKQELLVNPKNVLKNYKSEFKIKQISDKFEKNRALVEIDLYPKKIDDKKFSRLNLKVDKTQMQIYSIKYVGKDGVNILITITKFVENPQIADSEVKYSDNLFPEAEVIDMR